MPTRISSSSEFLSSLSAVLDKWMGDTQTLAKSKAMTSRISSAISITKATKSGTKIVASIEIDLDKAPEGRAYEYGSGIHATKGDRGTYPIVARNASALSFYWKNKDIWFVGKSVNHPGVAPHSSINAAVDERLPILDNMLLDIFGEILSYQIIGNNT